ncbi:MAG: uracil-DNA glycosylase [Terriglobia bacterium]
MDAQTKQQIADWLGFFRELGFEDLYRRPQAAVASLPSPENKMPAQPAAPQAVSSSVASSTASPAPQPKTLSLFDAPETPSTGPAQVGKIETLEEISSDLGDCHRCKLWKGRKHIVFGQGNPRAELVFIGEGPGADEDEQGLPFVGRAGQLLNKMLQLVQINREDVYICNVVKCRPPGNRTPESDEIAACSPFLFRQIDAIRPRLICCLGAPAARTVLGIKEGITKVHGQFLDYRNAKAMATVHPAYVLRNPREEVILRDDFAKIRDFLKVPRE